MEEKSHIAIMRAKRASVRNNKLCLLKEIGNLKHFILRKSLKIGKIENLIQKRHLAISQLFSNFSSFFDSFWSSFCLDFVFPKMGSNGFDRKAQKCHFISRPGCLEEKSALNLWLSMQILACCFLLCYYFYYYGSGVLCYSEETSLFSATPLDYRLKLGFKFSSCISSSIYLALEKASGFSFMLHTVSSV